MALIDRLAGIAGAEKLPVAQFVAGLNELAGGHVTRAQVDTFFDLDAQDQTDLDALIVQYTASTDKPEFLVMIGNIFYLAEQQVPGYDTTLALSNRIAAQD